MSSPIIERIIASSGYSGLLDWLSEELPGDDWQSLLLEVMNRRVQRVEPKDLLRAYERNRFVRPSRVAPDILLALDQLSLSLRGDFEAIELSPLAPLGACSALATVHQHKVVSALRHTEVVSDPTNLMTLEIALRRQSLRRERTDCHQIVRLMSSHRSTRAQYFDNPQFSAHFRLLCLCSGGRDGGAFRFETGALKEHLRFYLQWLAESERLNYDPGPLQVLFSDFTGGRMRSAVEESVIPSLQPAFPAVDFAFRGEPESGRGYYRQFRFQIELAGPAGQPIPLIDGGDTDWTQQLLSDRKERLVTSALGTQLYAQLFRKE